MSIEQLLVQSFVDVSAVQIDSEGLVTREK